MSSKKGKRLNPFQHALTRPDTYIGSIKTTTKEVWIFHSTTNDDVEELENEDDVEETVKKASSNGSIVLKKIRYNNGLTRIFVEIMSNAIDNKWRSEKHGIKMKCIDFTIDNDPESENYGWITVRNDGYCIPVRKEEYEYEDYRNGKTIKEEMYPAEVFFGEMLAGTNFEEDEDRKTSGRNGMGAKATIVFSKVAIVEHTNPEDGKMFSQTFYDNGTRRDKPKITSCKAKTGYTCFSFLPDYEYFGYPGMNEDLFSLFKRYVYECAMITGLNVTLNGEKVVVKDLQKFARLVYPDAKENCMMRFVAPNGDECVLMENGIPDQYTAESPSQISWINGINTRDGGVHVDAWVKAIFPTLVKAFNARGKKADALKTSADKLYPYFTIFVRSESYGVKFDSQTKDKLTEPDPYELVPGAEDKKNKAAQKAKKEFTAKIGEAMKKILKWGFVSLLEDKLSMFADKALSKTENAKTKHIALGKKGHDAYYAGKKSEECTLILSEGLSAKTFAEKLMGNPDYVGSLALKGKFINVQAATRSDVNKNEEVALLKKLMKLVTGVDYSDPEMRKMLRYGKVVIMADQDDDGIHIRGLVLNFFYTFWPSLFDLKASDGTPMIQAFNTAVCITRIGKKIDTIHFSNPAFKKYWEELDEKKKKKLHVQYYKGLGTHGEKDVAIYRKDPKYVQYTLDGDELEWMTLGFDKKNSDQRKEWVTRDMTKPGEMSLVEAPEREFTCEGPMSLSLFVDEQLVIYHKMSLRRALPNMFDSFKEGQRKVFFGIWNNPKARKHPVNVENLMGSVKEATGYHHGGVSLSDTIINMAQGFVGTNNIPLLCNAGMFGSRRMGGEDAAASRYIFTAIEEVARSIYMEVDEPLLKRNVEDNEEVEYEMYMPIVPVILINGAEGIASGYSTNISCYNPEDLVARIVYWLDSGATRESLDEFDLLTPWYRGWTGKPEFLQRSATGKGYEPWDPSSDKKPIAWLSKGTLTEGKKGWWHITELPVGMWTYRMKEWLEYFRDGTPPEKKKWKKIDRCITDMRDHGTSNTVSFDFKPTKDFIPDMDKINNFKIMQRTHTLTNMHVIDENGYPRKYKCAEDLLHDFCVKRLEYYGLRKEYWIEKWGKELERENNRYKYVKSIVDGKLKMNQKIAKVEEDMLGLGLKKLKPINEKKGKEEVEGDEETEGDSKASFRYLFMMPSVSLTSEKMAEIKKKIEEIQAKIDDYTNTTPEEMWKGDLDKFLVAYKKFLTTRCEELKEDE